MSTTCRENFKNIENVKTHNTLSKKELGTNWQGLSEGCKDKKEKAAVGFEPTDNGFANRRLRPLGYAAKTKTNRK